MAQELAFVLTSAPFPEGFQGDLDEYAQQLYQNTKATMIGEFLTGLILPPGSTLPTSDQGPIAMGGTWYFWDPATNQYLPQSVTQKTTKNFVKNSSYQIAQTPLGTTFNAIANGTTQTFDMCLVRSNNSGSIGSILAIAGVTGPPASADNDLIPAAIQYTTGPNTVASPGVNDLYAHEHLIEGVDLIMLQGQTTSLSFSVLVNLAGTYSIYLTNNGRDCSYVANFTITAPQAGQWVRVKINGIPPFPTTGTWNYGPGVTGLYIGFVMALGSVPQTSSPKQWNAGFWAGTSLNTNMVAVTHNTMTITGIKLEAAAAATYYQCPTVTAEYEEAIRYYYTTFDYNSTNSGAAIMGVCPTAGNGQWATLFPRRMCKSPTVTPYSNSSFTLQTIRNVSTAADVTYTLLSATAKGIAMYAAVGAASKGDVLAALIRADARLS